MDITLLTTPMTPDELKTSADWSQDPDFVCKECKKPAMKEPGGGMRWGCRSPQCSFLTRYPGTFFSKLTELV